MVLGKKITLSWYHVGLILLLISSAFIRLWRIDTIPYAVFDETHNAAMIAQYLDRRPFIDIHPPVARFHFTAVAYLSGTFSEHRFAGTLPAFNDFPYVNLRLVSVLAGILLTFFVTLLTYQLTGSSTASLMAGFFVVFENSFVLYSRLILPDMLLLTYGTAGLWCFFKSYSSAYRKRWFFCAVLLFSLAVGVKVTGYVFPAIALFYVLLRSPIKNMTYYYKMVGYFFVIPFLVSSLLIFIHFLVLSPEGPVYSVGSDLTIPVFELVRERNFFYQFGRLPGRITQRIGETIIAQLVTIGGVYVNGGNATASPAWLWPFMQKSMIFAVFEQITSARFIYLVGNPVIWWGGFLALLLTLYQRIKQGFTYQAVDVLLFGYFFYLFVMSFMGRSLYLYLYFPALLFLIIIMAMQLDRIRFKHPLLSVFLLVVVVISFIYIAPFTYGLPLSQFSQSELGIRINIPLWNPLNNGLLQ